MKKVDLSKVTGLDLGSYDYKILVDRSGSMASLGNNGNRWKDAHEISKEVANVCDQFDDDGIDIILFDHDFITINNVHAGSVDDIFRQYRPRGTTDTARALRSALSEFLPTKKSGGLFSKNKIIYPDLSQVKPLIIVVLTDGSPDNQSAVEEVIIEATTSLSSRKQLGITFLQVGNDRDASKFLKALDDDLERKGAKFDIIDTKQYTEIKGMDAVDIIIGALTD